MDFKSLAVHERPREKLMKHGPASLSDSELLAILLGTGTKNKDVLSVSAHLLTRFNLKKLSRAKISALQKELGVGQAKACQISACFELGRRLARFSEKNVLVRKSEDVAALLMEEMKGLNKEHLRAVFLNTKRKIIRTEDIFIGSLNESVIHPREIFQVAVEESAAALILVHNHPSGDPTPSSFDIDATRQILEAGDVLGIPVLDHLIIGDGKYISMREKKFI